MAGAFISHICVILILSRVESCFLPLYIQVEVPPTILPGDVISKVDVDHCDAKSLHLTLNDTSFKVESDRTIVASTTITVATSGRTFSVWAEDSSGEISEMEVHLVHKKVHQTVVTTDRRILKRFKRRWSPPPFNIIENDVPPFPKQIDVIGSDSQATHRVYYTISGPGVTEQPVGVFSVDRISGMLNVHRTVDREQYPQFVIKARVFDIFTNEETDLPLELTVIVDDVNDNKPTFTGSLQLTVLEQSKAGTVVGTVGATDRDQQNTMHTRIRYSLLTGADLFAIDPKAGVISTLTNTLDREVKDKYLVTVQIKDMDGATNGLSNTATATITLGDINDNPPTFTKSSYDVTVEENQNERLVLRLPVEDKDLVNTPNWNSQFEITKGNENGDFRIETDPKTNEGLLYITKPIDFEKNKSLKLEIMARNEAELSNTKATWVSVPVDVSVRDIDEGPEFTAPTVRFFVKENTPNGTRIGSYTALDPETKSSAGIRYYKVTDPDSWINVDVNSGELKVANTIDRESQFVQDGVYNITMKAVDASSKTGTGTVIIQVEDVNDHVPELPTSELVVCEEEELSSVLVVAEDKDQTPFSSPFSFTMADEHDGKWAVKRFNDTAATLTQTKDLPTGIYTVPLVVKDLQGSGRMQTVAVRICRCRNGACLAKQSSVSLGPLALLAMLLPLFLLLLLCLLLVFFCVTKREKLELEDMGDSGGNLIKSNTEAPGEEVDSNLLIIPTTGVEQPVKGSVKGSVLNAGWLGNKSSSTIGGFGAQDMGLYKSSGVAVTDTQNEYFSGQYDSSQFATGQFGGGQFVGHTQTLDNRSLFHDASGLHTWQTNGRYLQQKLAFLGTEEEGRYADDILHSYGFEGVGSAAGSVGCCSDQDHHDDLDFLNTLGPKFKTLAEVCRKT